MKSRKNYGRKIKRKRINLYPKRKTKAQKIAGSVLLGVVVLGITFLGYCLGKPLLEYFENNPDADSAPVWTPPDEPVETSGTEKEVTAVTTTETSEATTTTAPAVIPAAQSVYAVTVPSSALLNSASLSTFAAKSASEGFTAATVLLKDNTGKLRYISEIETVKGTDVITGKLTASEISKVLKDNGLKPIAVVSALSDNAGCAANPDMSYKLINEEGVSWLDYTTETPVRWANPESEATLTYLKAVKDELTAAGFEGVIETNVIFPDFQDYDRKYIAARYFSSDRYKLLLGAAEHYPVIEVNAEDIITGQLSKTAEVLKNKSALGDKKIIVKISRSAFPPENGYPADAGGLLEVVMVQAEAKATGFELIPMITGKEFSADDIKNMKETAEKTGYEDFYIG